MDKTKLEALIVHTGTISEGLAARQERRVKEIMHERKCTFEEANNIIIKEKQECLEKNR